jgi:hypothetical protein
MSALPLKAAVAIAYRRVRFGRRISPGDLRYTSANTVLKRRRLLNPARMATSVIGKSVSSSSRLARCTRAVFATCTGLAPKCRANSLVRWRAPTPTRLANISTEAFSPSSAPSRRISRVARSTVVRLPFHAAQNGAVSGRHLKHGRKPAASAAIALGKNRTFSARAGRTGQTGRQYIPVVRTPVKNSPS